MSNCYPAFPLDTRVRKKPPSCLTPQRAKGCLEMLWGRGKKEKQQQKKPPPQFNAKPNHKLKWPFVKGAPRKLGRTGPLRTATADTAIFLGRRSASSPRQSLHGCRKISQAKILTLEDANTGMCNLLNIKSRSKKVSSSIKQCHKMTAMGQQRHQGNRAT